MINTAVIGYGFAGKSFHSYLVNLADGLDLYAVATRDPERRASAGRDHPDIVCYETLDQVLADDNVHLVVLGTPHNIHAEMAIRAMNAGKHVVTDKIMCMNVAEADAMIEAAQRNQVLLSVFHNRRWDWDYLTVKKTIEDGLLGAPYLFQTAIMRHGGPRGWRGVSTQSGGLLYDWGAHLVDQALQLVPGRVETVYCDLQNAGGWNIDIGNYALLRIQFENGVRYQVEIGNLALVEKPRWYVLGDKGGLIKYGLDPQEQPMKEGHIDTAEEDPQNYAMVWTVSEGEKQERVIESVRGSWKSYYQNIADVLNSGVELIVKPEQVRRAMVVFDAAKKSAETREVVHL